MFIELQTGAFQRSIKCNKGTTFQLIGTLAGVESINFEQPDGAGGWAAIAINGTAVALTATNTIITVSYPALIRLNKEASAAAAGVLLVS